VSERVTTEEGTFLYLLKKGGPTEASLHKEQETKSVTSSVSDGKRFGGASSSNSQKIRVDVIQIPRTSLRRVMQNESGYDCRPLFINE
jgi:hypothetical protein